MQLRFLLLIVALFSVPASILCAEQPASKLWPPRVIFNSDAASTTLYRFPVPITDEQCVQAIVSLKETPVDWFAMSIGAGGSVFWESDFGHLYGTNFKHWVVRPGAESVINSLRHHLANETSVRERGVDITKLRLERAQQQDMLFLASIRMNDSHEDDEGRFWMGRSEFKIEHPELLLGSPTPKTNTAPRDCNFSWGFNYARPEVRERRCKLVEEICSRYDVDGVELDFMRTPAYFRVGEVFKNIPHMTDMVKRIRNILDQAAQAKGKRLYLVVRVPPTVGTSVEMGLDAETWINEGLVDIVVPMTSSILDSEAEIDKFVEIADASGGKTLIYGGIEPMAGAHGPGSNFDLCRAVAYSAYAEGAAGIYLFNYDCHNHDRSGIYNEEEREFLHQIGSAESLRWENKIYFVTPLFHGTRYGGDPLRQIPKRLALIGRGGSPGHAVTLKFYDDLAAARQAGKLESVQLQVKIANIDVDYERLRMSLNGQPLPLERGSNSLLVLLDGVENTADWEKWPELQLVEAVVRYK